MIEMRLLVIENGLRTANGHHFNNSQGLKQACESLGIKADFFINRRASPAIVSAIGATPCFEYSPYDRVSRDPLCGELKSFLIQSQAIADDFSTAQGNLGAEDCLVVPSAACLGHPDPVGMKVSRPMDRPVQRVPVDDETIDTAPPRTAPGESA
jgi:hypothetical protein